MEKKSKNRLFSLLFVLIFMLSVSSLFTSNYNNLDSDTNISIASDNYLFNGKEYDIELNDIYDDEDLYKIYTGANFSYVFLENESTTFNEVVSPVNNNERQLGDPNEFTMNYGTTDGLDNMKAYDGSYTSFYSSDLPPVHHEMPVQWTDFSYIYGSSGGVAGTGSTQYNDAVNYAYMNAESDSGSETLLGYIKPNQNILQNWNNGDTTSHYLLIDEAKGDMNGDGGNIRETSVGVSDRWNFDSLTIPANSEITRLYIGFYTVQSGYTWQYIDKTGLSIDQTELNALYVNVLTAGSSVFCDIETVYIDVYYTTTTYRHTSEITWDYTGANLDYLDTLYYDYATTVAIDCDLDIWDWVSSGYVELQSNTGTSYITSSYDLSSNPNKVSGSNQVRIRFETASASSDFDVRLDQLMFDYVLTTDTDPELETIMETTFSNYDSSKILSIEVESYHKTDVAQTIVFSIYNYDTPAWETITSQSQTSFTQSLFQNTSSPNNYFDNDGKMKLRYYGTSSTQEFDLHIDNLNVTITYKMDLSHSITFNTNGLWKYRWTLFGSIQYTSWIYFEVIDPEPNFYAISESELTTRWILQDNKLTPIEDFHDDINTNYWGLIDVSNSLFDYSEEALHDSYTASYDPDKNYDSWTSLTARNTTTYQQYIYLGFDMDNLDYLLNNQSDASSQIKLYSIGGSGDSANLYCYNTSSFNENTITWNNQPSLITEQDHTLVSSSVSWFYWDIPYISEYFMFKFLSQTSSVQNFYSHEATQSTKRPFFVRYNVSKNYFGDGYMYMQTDITESLSLKSQDYGTHKTLNSGDYFEIDFQTSSDSKIELILLKDGVVNKTLTLSVSGNTNFNRHTAKISVAESLEFDQLKISSTFEDTDNIKVYDIKTYKYALTGDHADFYVGSKRDREVYLTPDTYNLRIFEEGDEKISENITIPTTGILDYVYTPIERLECRLTLFNTEGSHLDFMDYHIKVNRSLNGVYNEFWLLDSIFSADSSTYANITIYDRFDTLIDTFKRLTSDYIDLEIEVYSLQIKNLMTQKTTLDINGTYIYPLLSGDSIYFMLSKSYYQIGYYDTNDVYKQFTIYLDSNQAYELNKSRICFLSYADQQGTHLNFENYKTYINGSLIYENIFYREIGDIVGIEIKDRYDISIKNETHTVVSGDNYIPITLTMYSLKVMNQQENFNWINITRDPNYYESSMYWSEWIAPTEIIEFTLFAGYYKINLTDNENSGSSYYSYTLNGDDILLISSGNIISNVIYNIENVNVTLGNQITNVQIDLTNQNSEINNSIINIDINISNLNSSLGDLLTNIDLDITNINNNISSLYVFTNNSFINLDNNINNSFIYMENNIISINQTISNLVIGVSNDVHLINGTISTLITQMENNLFLMNVSLDTAIFNLDTTVTEIGNNITNNYILLNNSITLANNNINDSRIAIINNLALINNTISNLISQVYSSVYMINNSIYTAVIDMGTSLSLINNSISGDLTIMLQQNDFLTELYQTTMFSDLLNWTNIGYNSSLIDSQIDVWEFINNYKNQSIEVHLRYQDIIDNLTITAQNSIFQYLPKDNTDYNLWSVEDQEYLDDWKPLPENRTVPFGFYEEVVPDIPDFNAPNTVLMIIIILMGCGSAIALVGYLAYRYRKKSENYRRSYADKVGLEAETIKNFSQGRRIR
jgi:hypothetical protein